jgi:PAS domain S-box-containing protein
MSPVPTTLDRDSWLLTSINAAVIVTDLDGTVTYWNAAAEQLYGYSADQMLGSSATDTMVRVADRGRIASLRTRLLAGEQIVHELAVLCRDGSTRWMRVSDSPLRQDGDVVGTVGVHIPAGELAVAHEPAGEVGLRVAYADTSFAGDAGLDSTHAHHPGQDTALCHIPIVPGVGTWPPTQATLCPDCQQRAAGPPGKPRSAQ